MNTFPIGSKPSKDLFYVKEMTDTEFKNLDFNQMKKLSRKEADELLFGKNKRDQKKQAKASK